MRVLTIHRYPLKSAAGQRLDTVELTPRGLPGDRTWACRDGADGTIGSAKQPRRWQRLLDVTARLSSSAVTVAVPGHPEAAAGSPEADTALSAWLGRPVQLINTVPPQAKLHRLWPDEPGLLPEWAGDARPGAEAVTPMAAPDGRFFDFGPIHIVTAAALDLLGRQHGAAVDPIRFRPNLVLDLPDEPAPGRRLRLGAEAVIEFAIPTPRCVIPSIAHGAVPAEPGLLRTLARHYRTQVGDYGRATCFGYYATVVHPGTVSVADQITPLAG